MTAASCELLLCLTPKGEHVARKVIKLLIRQRKLGHDGARRHRGWVAKMLDVPCTVGARIGDVRQIRADSPSCAMNPVTSQTPKLFDQRLTVRDARINSLYAVQIFQRNTQQ